MVSGSRSPRLASSKNSRSLRVRTMDAASRQAVRLQLGPDENVLSAAEPISDAADGFDHVRAKLLAQRTDVDVHEVGGRVEGIAPHVREELLPAQHLTRVAEERLEQGELAGRPP